MELEELEDIYVKDMARRQGAQPTEWVEDEDPGEDQATLDIQEAMALLITTKTMIDYIANPSLCKVVSKRERDIMGKLSEKIRTFLASVEPTYSEGE